LRILALADAEEVAVATSVRHPRYWQTQLTLLVADRTPFAAVSTWSMASVETEAPPTSTDAELLRRCRPLIGVRAVEAWEVNN
jgi:hypothetical protein